MIQFTLKHFGLFIFKAWTLVSGAEDFDESLMAVLSDGHTPEVLVPVTEMDTISLQPVLNTVSIDNAMDIESDLWQQETTAASR